MTLTQQDLDAIALAVRDNLSPELSLIEEQFFLLKDIHTVMGLDYNNPLTVTQTTRIAGNVYQDVVLDSINKSTLITRRIPQTEVIGTAVIGSTFVVG